MNTEANEACKTVISIWKIHVFQTCVHLCNPRGQKKAIFKYEGDIDDLQI